MNAAIIGLVTGLLVISVTGLVKQINKSFFYGLTLCGIGFLYVGYTWSHKEELIVNSIQAILFLFFSYYGMKKSVSILALGFFLHGSWDLA